MEKILISACLVGEKCKYDGGDNPFPLMEKLAEKYELVPFCPEVAGGLPTPREPAEIVKNSVLTQSGKDVTAQFNAGAEAALKACKYFGIRIAILKENSPSCGPRHIDDGTFTHTRLEGLGVTARLLIANGIKVYADNDNLTFLLGESEEVKQQRLERNLKKEEERKALQEQVKAGVITQEDMDRRLLQKKEQEKARRFGHGGHSHGGHSYGNISHGSRPYGEHRSYGHKPYEGNRGEGEGAEGEHSSYEHKSYGHSNYGNSSYGHSNYGHSNYGHSNYGHKPYGEHSEEGNGENHYEHKPYGEHSSYGHKPYGEHSSYGHKPYGEHNDHKPYGEHKSYDRKPYEGGEGEHKNYGHSNYGHSNSGHSNYGHGKDGHSSYGHSSYGHKSYNKNGGHGGYQKKIDGNGDK